MLIGSFNVWYKELDYTKTALKIFSRAQFLDGIFRLHSVMFIFREISYLIVTVQSTMLTYDST